MRIVDLAPAHAEEAARLHIAGQPGTFLSSLGPEVLTVLYRVLPQSSAGFGYAMMGTLSEDARESLVAFVSATTSVGSLFVEVMTQRLGQFAPALMRCYARRPTLIWRSMQTLTYPLRAGHGQGDVEQTAELLSIMVAPALRSQGIGSQLVTALVAECAARRIAWLDVTVDADNRGARRFYERHQFVVMRTFSLYGRTMCAYRRTLDHNGG